MAFFDGRDEKDASQFWYKFFISLQYPWQSFLRVV
jgi:hypothetical protein